MNKANRKTLLKGLIIFGVFGLLASASVAVPTEFFYWIFGAAALGLIALMIWGR